MSSVRLFNVDITTPESGPFKVICDWNKGGAITTCIQIRLDNGELTTMSQQTHATLAAAFGRCARLAKRMGL